MASLIGTLSLLVLNSWWIILTVPVLGVMYMRIAGFYRNSARELQRLDSISKSPIYAAFSEALGGAATIQAYGRTRAFEAANMARFDRNLRARDPSWGLRDVAEIDRLADEHQLVRKALDPMPSNNFFLVLEKCEK